MQEESNSMQTKSQVMWNKLKTIKEFLKPSHQNIKFFFLCSLGTQILNLHTTTNEAHTNTNDGILFYIQVISRPFATRNQKKKRNIPVHVFTYDHKYRKKTHVCTIGGVKPFRGGVTQQRFISKKNSTSSHFISYSSIYAERSHIEKYKNIYSHPLQ